MASGDLLTLDKPLVLLDWFLSTVCYIPLVLLGLFFTVLLFVSFQQKKRIFKLSV